MKGYFIYFYYDKNDELLYIGKSIDAGQRWQNHQENWKDDVVKIGVREYPDHAIMDIMEHYYITKLPTKYNKDLLYHGMTTVDINDSSEITFYSLESFKKKFLPKTSTQTTKSKRTVEERLLEMGYKIIDVPDGKINLFDDDLLELDLDRVCFKYNIDIHPTAKAGGFLLR